MKRIVLRFLIISILSIILTGCGSFFNGKIYFVSEEWKTGKTPQDNLGICVYDGHGVKKLYQGYTGASASPDGSKIIAHVINSNKEFVIIDPKNNVITKCQIPYETIIGTRWFCDNKKIAYVGSDRADMKTAVYNIYTYDLKTKHVEKITSYTEINKNISSIALSPDDNYIAYTIQLGQDIWSGRIVKIINIKTKQEEDLPFSADGLTWSPDGKTIAMSGIYSYKGKKEFGNRVILYDIKSKTYKKLNKPGGEKAYMWESDLVYSPDGKKIAFVRNENNSIRTLCVMNSDGTNRKKIHSSRYIAHVSWSK